MRALSYTWFLLLPALAASAATVDELIQQAGNAPSDAARLQLLETLAAHPEMPAGRQQEARRLAEEIARYLHDDNLYYFDREVRKSDDYDFGVAIDSPLYPLTHLYRGRMLVWVTLEYGGYWSEPEKMRARMDMVRAVLEKAHEAFPEEPLARM